MKQYLLRLFLASICMFWCLCPFAQTSATTTTGFPFSDGAAPMLSKPQWKSLDKAGSIVYKQCQDTSVKKVEQAAEGCIQLAIVLKNQFQDSTGARTALQRSCFLGSARGCDHLGTDLAEAGDTINARVVWGSPKCNSPDCKELLFNSLADMPPQNLSAAEEVGRSLCEGEDNQKVCSRLKDLGSPVDFAAISQRRADIRKQRIEKLTREVQEAEQEAADSKAAYEKYNADAQANPNAVGLVASISALGFANDYRNKTNRANRLRSQLSSMNAEQPEAITAPSGSMVNALDSQQAILSAQAKGPLGGGAVFPSEASATTTGVPTAAAPTASPVTVMYTGENAEWVQQLLSKSGPYSCAPKRAPALPRTFACVVRDGSVYKAIAIAWATECEAQTGNSVEATKYAQAMLDVLKQASAGCEGMRTSCTSDNIISCSQLPKR